MSDFSPKSGKFATCSISSCKESLYLGAGTPGLNFWAAACAARLSSTSLPLIQRGASLVTTAFGFSILTAWTWSSLTPGTRTFCWVSFFKIAAVKGRWMTLGWCWTSLPVLGFRDGESRPRILGEKAFEAISRWSCLRFWASSRAFYWIAFSHSSFSMLTFWRS